MDRHSQGRRVQVYFGESDHVGHVPRHQALLTYLRREGAAGVTITRGVAGFGADSRIHTSAILRLALDLPMVLTWIDAPGRVERLLPGLVDLAGSGVVTVEDVEIVAYGGRRLEQLRFDLEIRDVMSTPAVVVEATAPVLTAVERLLGREFRALPVVDEANRLVGVISSGDLVARSGLGARLELLSAMPAPTRQAVLAGFGADRPVGTVMTVDVTSVHDRDTVATATHLMAARHLKRLPVVDDDGAVVGVISRADMLRAVGETFPRDASAAAHPGARTVGELMRQDAPVVRASADLATLLSEVVSTRLNRAVVVDDDRHVLGVISDADILRSVDPTAGAGVLQALMRTTGHPPGGTVRAGELLSRPPRTVSPGTTIAEAARLATESGRKVLCVADDDGRLLGIVDRADLLGATGDALRDLGKLARDPSGEDV